MVLCSVLALERNLPDHEIMKCRQIDNCSIWNCRLQDRFKLFLEDGLIFDQLQREAHLMQLLDGHEHDVSEGEVAHQLIDGRAEIVVLGDRSFSLLKNVLSALGFLAEEQGHVEQVKLLDH